MMTKPTTDIVDLREIRATLRRRAKWIVASTLLGGLLAWGVNQLLTPRYESGTLVLLRNNADAVPTGLPQLGGFGGLFARSSAFDTELKILTSRTLIATVVDSLGMQARVLRPVGLRPQSVFSSARYPRDLADGKYEFERNGDRYEVTGRDFSGVAVPGVPFNIKGAVVTLRRDSLPDAFKVELLDMEDAISLMRGRVRWHGGGETFELLFLATDPVTAAAVPNALVTRYVNRRKTTDRGANQERYAFLTERADSVARELASVENAIRTFQERYGVFDPEFGGKADLGRAKGLKVELEGLDVEINALQGLLAQRAAGKLATRDLAAYPTFLRNGAINNVLLQMLDLEAKRSTLLVRRTENDVDVKILENNLKQLEDQLVSLSSAYLTGLTRQREQIARELEGYQVALKGIPGGMQSMERLNRERGRLTEISLALQAQIMQSRLAAISEGGDIRQIDPAIVPKMSIFPRRRFNIALGLMGGLFFGLVGAIATVRLRPQIDEPWEAELITGVPAIGIDPRLPLWFETLRGVRTVLLLPTGPSTEVLTVGERLAETAALQGREAVLADLTQPGAIGSALRRASVGASTAPALVGTTDHVMFSESAVSDGEGYSVYRMHENGNSRSGHRSTVGELEQRFSLLIAALPSVENAAALSVLAPERPIILVGRSGQITRAELRDALEVCRRMGVPVMGIVLQPAGDGARVA
ncbi:MAG: Wzz/FepE/Etk N-terminal domain-containing protein [Gemmatimonadota bacterium]|nr:Wzz/FepE/Etk N-terminal domain-containing protein [Gemmatimonadota bacterium]